MAAKTLFALGWFAFSQVGADATFARSGETTSVILALSVFNDAAVPGAVLEQAESTAGRILAHAGIAVEWLNCRSEGPHVPDQFEKPSACSSIAYPAHLSLRIVRSGKSTREEISGEAFADRTGKGTYINLYYAHLLKANKNALGLLGEGELLGCVMAHEIGHLLLGTNSHGREGIMQGRWEGTHLRSAGKGELQFTPLQAAAMRERLAEALIEDSQRHAGGK
jgi:hypothetical protein